MSGLGAKLLTTNTQSVPSSRIKRHSNGGSDITKIWPDDKDDGGECRIESSESFHYFGYCINY
jgi:hypothetical protein